MAVWRRLGFPKTFFNILIISSAVINRFLASLRIRGAKCKLAVPLHQQNLKPAISAKIRLLAQLADIMI